MSIATQIRSANEQFLPGKLFFSPEWIVLGVNNICNLHCKMCDVGTKNQSTNFAVNLVGTHPMNMPMELFKNICDDVKKYYPKAKIGYGFTEPLIYPHLEESIAYATSQGLYTSVTTNALNLRQKAEVLISSKVNEVFISLDGLEETHNYIRGHKSSFQKAIAGIEELLKHDNPPDISIFCVITNWNQNELKAFADFFKKFPIKILGFMHTNYTMQKTADAHNLIYNDQYPATASNIDEFNPADLDLPQLQKELVALKKGDYPFQLIFSPDIQSLTDLETFYLKPEILMGKGCKDVFRNIMIKSDGSVIPAHGRCYNLTIGNMNEQNLKSIWSSEILKRFRKDLAKSNGLLPACSRCCSAF
ncbi:MAG: radical SAM protein [Flavobacteriales bacterium]|nr:radical SAM protein [Flavobacteriales bacterium]